MSTKKKPQKKQTAKRPAARPVTLAEAIQDHAEALRALAEAQADGNAFMRGVPEVIIETLPKLQEAWKAALVDAGAVKGVPLGGSPRELPPAVGEQLSELFMTIFMFKGDPERVADARRRLAELNQALQQQPAPDASVRLCVCGHDIDDHESAGEITFHCVSCACKDFQPEKSVQ